MPQAFNMAMIIDHAAREETKNQSADQKKAPPRGGAQVQANS
jgi:hypothetical protein